MYLFRGMQPYDSRIDAYIAKSAAFAQPVLEHLRGIIHEACPEVAETIKWSMPAFEYKGPLCGFAAFKAHCTFGFWKAALLHDPHGVLKIDEPGAMASFGKMTSQKDLPPDNMLKALIKDAMRLNDDGIKMPAASRARGKKPEIPEPEYLTKLLAANAAAQETWNGFAPSHRREYLEWITGAKTEPTREKAPRQNDRAACGRKAAELEIPEVVDSLTG